MEIEILADADAVARRAAQVIAADARAAAGRGRFVIGVSGGHTPWQMLRNLADEDVPWPIIELVQVDERVAPDGDPDRNLTHLRESLLDRSPLKPSQIHPMPVNDADLVAAAARYAETLNRLAGSPPTLDLVHLGLGPDGHTASLVPGDPVLDVTDRDVAASGVYQGRRRMTLTFPMLDRARRVLWVVTGESKVEMLRRLRAGDTTIPAGRVRRDRALVLADRAAAGESAQVASSDGAPAGAIEGVGPVGKVEKVKGGFKFVEGPAADKDGTIYFSDIPASRVYRLEADGETSIFREPSGHTNGSMFNAEGELVSCEMDGRLVVVSRDGKTVRPLAAAYMGKRFNAPNDLVVDTADGVYFTDPEFRAPNPLPQGVTAVYYVGGGGAIERLIDDLKAPNGVILSVDEKTLYVAPYLQEEVMAYAVESPGKLGPAKVFCRLKQAEGQQGRGGDGLTIDSEGRLYIATGLGLQVFDSAGKYLGTIETPEPPANVTFGGKDFKTLYITAGTSLYRAPMKATGHRFAK